MKVFVFGWYNHDNIGDESYKLSFKSIWPEHDFVFGEKVEEDIYDLCIIGGGDVVREHSLKSVSKLSCPKIALSVTITKQSLSADVHLLEHIYVRDNKSYDTLKEFGYDRVTYLPDISCILTGNVENGKKLISSIFKSNNLEQYEKVYTIVINSHLLGNSQSKNKDKIFFDKMVTDISEMIDRTPASFLFIPFSTRFPWDDRITNGLVNSYTKYHKKNCVIYDKLSVDESLDIISASDLLITSRFHGLIFGLANHIPLVTISFHDKISGFCETVEECYIDYYNLNLNDLELQLKNSRVNNKLNANKIKNDYLEKVYLLRER
jgi:polysaccharide pyruvyl transferase WcaK-like protein